MLESPSSLEMAAAAKHGVRSLPEEKRSGLSFGFIFHHENHRSEFFANAYLNQVFTERKTRVYKKSRKKTWITAVLLSTHAY